MEGLVASKFAISAPLTRDNPSVDIPCVYDHPRQRDRQVDKGADPLVAGAIERWENEGGAVKSPSKPGRLRDPNHLGEFSVDLAKEEEPPNA